MKKNYQFIVLFILTIFNFITVLSQNNSDFYLAENGVTCLCPEAEVGERGTLIINEEEKTFTKRSETELRNLIDADQNNPEIALSCVSGITDMSGLFGGKTEFNQNIRSWDVSQVNTMKEMFASAANFNQSLNDWDVSQVYTMQSMFVFASKFDQSLNNWNVSQVTDMSGMFEFAINFDQPLNNWNVYQVTSMRGMFNNAENFNQTISDWNVSQVADMAGMFFNANQFNQPINNWDVSQVTNMFSMFRSATSFNQDLSGWCVGQIPTEPGDFDTNTNNWTLPNSRPVWGSCPTLSTEMPNELGFVLYPNPASSQVYLNNPSNLKLSSLTIYDMTGRQIKSQVISLDSQASVDVLDLSSGSYILEVNTKEGQTWTQRLLVN